MINQGVVVIGNPTWIGEKKKKKIVARKLTLVPPGISK